MKLKPNDLCPCGSKKKYKKCCRIYHLGKRAETALFLMKSRYSAFCVKDYQYIIQTTHCENVDFSNDLSAWSKSILEFATLTKFEHLEILAVEENETESFVTFKATLFQEDQDISFCEKSRFLKEKGTWLYHSGEFL